MKKSLVILAFALAAGTQLSAQQNPAAADPLLSQAPLNNIGSQFDISFKVGNAGTNIITGIGAANQMKFTISLGKCKPSVNNQVSTIGTDALTGLALLNFDVTYDPVLNMYFGTQKPGIAVGMLNLLPIVVHVQVTALSPNTTTNDIGGTMNVQPNPSSNGQNITSDDQVNIFTHTVGTPLPVVLEDFTARAAGCAVALDWKTGSEQNFDRFEIERGSDRGYTQIGSVKAKGNNSVYAFTDAKPGTNTNIYRLKMVDADGTFTYSEVASAKASCPVAATEVAVYPNPTTGMINVKGLKEGSTLRLVDVTGRMLMEKNNTAAVEMIDLSRLPSALYTLQVIENGALTATVKVSRQ
jgi:hypothetical protein